MVPDDYGFEMMPLDGLAAAIEEEAKRGEDEDVVKKDKSDRLVFLDPHFVNPQIDMSKNLES